MSKKFNSKPEMPGVVMIYHPHSWGSQLADRKWWMSEKDGEVEDYHFKNHLKRAAEENGDPWVVLRCHRDGTWSIVESSTAGTQF